VATCDDTAKETILWRSHDTIEETILWRRNEPAKWPLTRQSFSSIFSFKKTIK